MRKVFLFFVNEFIFVDEYRSWYDFGFNFRSLKH